MREEEERKKNNSIELGNNLFVLRVVRWVIFCAEFGKNQRRILTTIFKNIFIISKHI